MTQEPENTIPEASVEEAARRRSRANRRVALGALGGAIFMVGAAYAAVPLYEIFCQVTGYGGTTQRAESVTGEVIDRKITVRFDGNVNSALPWKFGPDVHAVTLRMGETGTMSYHATNLGGDGTVGTSVFNVTPFEAGAYFNKIQCFCFTEQPLAAGETVEMPVVFFVDPEMDKDPQLKDVKEITLSYTFYPDKTAETPVAAKTTGAGEEKNSL
jgi:cytochrome c oxidase assembly protein subunit 11